MLDTVKMWRDFDVCSRYERCSLPGRASGRSPRSSASVSRRSVSSSSSHRTDLDEVHPEVLLEAAAPVLRTVAEECGFTELAVFGSLARKQARPYSDVDLLVRAPAKASSLDLLALRMLLEQVLGRPVDLIDYGGLRPGLDEDIRQEAVLL